MKLKNIFISAAIAASVSSYTPVYASGIPVVDVAQIIQDAALWGKDLAQTYMEWEHKLEQVRSIVDRFGPDFFMELVAERERVWGKTEFTDLITLVGVGDMDAFVTAMNAVFLAYIGGHELEAEDIESIIIATGIEDPGSQQMLKDKLNLYNNRQAFLSDSIVAAAGVEERLEEYRLRSIELADKLSGLGKNSDTASIQHISATNLAMLDQQREQMSLLAKLVANQNQETMMANMDTMKSTENYHTAMRRAALKNEIPSE
ncbi:hypothetical protein OAS86_02245 [Gammaproteobacteria bacterium]|nr:hypothetical protein [Gammaproteobacteria bacterium]